MCIELKNETMYSREEITEQYICILSTGTIQSTFKTETRRSKVSHFVVGKFKSELKQKKILVSVLHL